MTRILLFLAGLASGLAGVQKQAMAQQNPVLVIAHRGASGERPEHTRLSYELAIAQGADVIEPDLVPTKDGYLVARHENNITDTTDVAAHPEFADRKATKTIDGETMTGWFTEDFTLAELKTLRAKERLPQLRPANKAYDGQAEILTIDEVVAIAKQGSARTGRTIGIYPETKHPSYFASIGLPLEERLVKALDSAGWNSAEAPVYIQSFEVDNLKKLKGLTKVRLIQLMAASGAPADKAQPSYAAMATAEGLRAVAAYAWGVGPEKPMILSADGKATSFVADAHAAGLKVHPWTFRIENFFLAPAYRAGTDPVAHGDLSGEIHAFLKLGIDGFFTDNPHQGAEAVRK